MDSAVLILMSKAAPTDSAVSKTITRSRAAPMDSAIFLTILTTKVLFTVASVVLFTVASVVLFTDSVDTVDNMVDTVAVASIDPEDFITEKISFNPFKEVNKVDKLLL